MGEFRDRIERLFEYPSPADASILLAAAEADARIAELERENAELRAKLAARKVAGNGQLPT